MAGNDYAIIIGLQYYPGLGDPQLSGPEYDAQQFKAWVLSNTGGDVPPANVTTILSSDFAVPNPPSLLFTRPGELEIIGAFENLRALSKINDARGVGQKVGRRLYLYMSGHGIAPVPYGNVTEEESALLLSNTDPEQIKVPRYHIPGNYVASWFCRNDFFDEVFLFMDCCRDQLTVPYINYIFPPTGTANTAKKFYAFATKWARRARERVINGQMQGIFTKTLLLALNGAAAVSDPASAVGGSITFESLKSFLINNMKCLIDPAYKEDPEVLEPQIQCFPDNNTKQVIINTPVKTFPVTVPVIPGAVGEVGVYSQTKKDYVARIPAEKLPQQVELAREEYVINAVVNGSLYSLPLSVRGLEGQLNGITC